MSSPVVEQVDGPYNFPMALEALIRDGSKIACSGWHGKNMYVQKYDRCVQIGTEDWCFIRTPDGKVYPWNPSQRDLFATDWYVVDFKPMVAQ